MRLLRKNHPYQEHKRTAILHRSRRHQDVDRKNEAGKLDRFLHL
jgi:hypothetical protein